VFAADAMAWAMQVNGRHEEALTFADKAGVFGWRNASFAFHRGMILASLGRNADATAALGEALAINPYFSPLHAAAARGKLAELEAVR
jgi:Flp pilus assembly protein TadD